MTPQLNITILCYVACLIIIIIFWVVFSVGQLQVVFCPYLNIFAVFITDSVMSMFLSHCFKAFWFFNEKFAQNAGSTINQDPSDGEGEDCIAGGKSLKTACLSSKKIKEVLLLRWIRVWFLI